MAHIGVDKVIGHLRRRLLAAEGTGLADAKLLGQFVESGDQEAFEILMRRHGPMVFGVCRRILANSQDAEDAFQATFLVLVRKASSVRPREMLGNWLYGVALQTAQRARALNAKRQRWEKQVTAMAEPYAAPPNAHEDWRPFLDQELSGLPRHYRAAIVACDLEGKTRNEAARQLGWPEGSVASRLARGRALLARRLAKHIPAFSVSALAADLSRNGALSQPPAALLLSTLEAACIVSAGQLAVTALISEKVVSLTEGVLKAMLLSKLKAVAMGLVVCMLGIGMGASLVDGQAPKDAAPPLVRGKKAHENAKAAIVKDSPMKEAPGSVIGLQKLKPDFDDFIRATYLDLYKFQIPIAKGQKFRILWREYDGKSDEARGGQEFNYEKTTDKPTIVRVSFLRQDGKLEGVLLSEEKSAWFRLECEGCNLPGLVTIVSLPLRGVDKILYTANSDKNAQIGAKGLPLLSLWAKQPDSRRAELAVELVD